jgi:mono/diheme cytochrome c family protein
MIISRKNIKLRTLIALAALCFIISASLVIPDKSTALFEEDMRLFKLMEGLGYEGVDHFPDTDLFGVSAQRGESLIREGFSSRPGGGRTKKQSKHFVCTSCHNLEKEDPDLANPDPQDRLVYTEEKGMPFLQGTSLYGAVNRERFYNDDYYKKYGELVVPARENIREAIQLCAVECSQGRKLLPWELESILAYLWTIDLKLSDLNLSPEEVDYVEKAYRNKTNQDSALIILQSKYRTDSPAHFTTAYDSKLALEKLEGNPENGQLIYENSCLHCHADRRYSYFLLDNDQLTFKHLSKKALGYGYHSLIQVTRFGVYSKAGKRSYMPQYPLEKMSNQQLADLHAYIQMKASE